MVGLVRVLPLLVLGILALFVLPSAAAALTDPNPANDRWVEATLRIRQPDLTTLDVAGDLVVRKYVVAGTSYETAEELAQAYQDLQEADRLAEANGQPGDRADAFVEDLAQSAEEAFLARLRETYPTAELSGATAAVDLESLERGGGDPFEPGIEIAVAARIERGLETLGAGDLTEAEIDAAFRAGAIVRSTIPLTAGAGQKVTYVIEPPASPDGLAFLTASGEGASIVEGDLVMVVDATTQTAPKSADISFDLASADAPRLDRQDAQLDVTVDLQDVDISVGGAARGDMGTLIGAVEITGELRSIAVPDSTKAQLGDNVILDFLSSDALRLLRSSGLVTQDRFDALETEMAAQMRERLEASLGTSVDVTLALDEASLDAPVSSPLSSEVPIVFHARATFAKPLSGGAAAQAVALYTVQQSFELPRIQGLDTTYTVILPRGLSLASIDATDAEKSSTTRPDGRESFTVTPHGESTVATVAMAVTGTFVVAKFWPVLLGAVVLLVLLVGTPIALVVVRRRKPPVP